MIQASKYLGVAPWELGEQSFVWAEYALLCQQAEVIEQEHQQKKAMKKRK